jgi:hypothetical protein
MVDYDKAQDNRENLYTNTLTIRVSPILPVYVCMDGVARLNVNLKFKIIMADGTVYTQIQPNGGGEHTHTAIQRHSIDPKQPPNHPQLCAPLVVRLSTAHNVFCMRKSIWKIYFHTTNGNIREN